MCKLGLEWKNIKLIHYSKENFDFIYSAYQEYNSIYLFCNQLEIKSKNEFWSLFIHKIENIYNEFMIIINKENNSPIGFIYSYNYNTNNQTIYTAIYIIEKWRKGIVGATAGLIFFNHIFKTKPIRKIYCTVYDFNKDSINLLKSAQFREEGVLNKHRYLNGCYYDLHIMALKRTDFYEFIEKNLKI